jgi:hypothetical protein
MLSTERKKETPGRFLSLFPDFIIHQVYGGDLEVEFVTAGAAGLGTVVSEPLVKCHSSQS